MPPITNPTMAKQTTISAMVNPAWPDDLLSCVRICQKYAGWSLFFCPLFRSRAPSMALAVDCPVFHAQGWISNCVATGGSMRMTLHLCERPRRNVLNVDCVCPFAGQAQEQLGRIRVGIPLAGHHGNRLGTRDYFLLPVPGAADWLSRARLP